VALDLSRARAKIESLMEDMCVITRDPPGTSDDVVDEDTGLTSSTGAASQTIYSGKCFFAPTGIGSIANAEGQPERNPGYRTLTAFIPLDAPEILENDTFTVTASQRDPLAVGRDMTVVGIRFNTFAIGRQLDVTDVR
jgi:hypothetical protein